MYRKLTGLGLLIALWTSGYAQVSDFPTTLEELTTTITELDAQFWEAYNQCDVDEMAKYLTDDIEFYHDRGGLTLGKEDLVNGMRAGLCGSNPQRLRREEVSGTIEIYPIADYGAIIRGSHHFYVVSADGEFLDGAAQFTHLWRYTDGVWQMARVYSFDHKAPE
ncbi:MAG: nuclear transport factor 2 family protein [Bacteroidota bacterium]